MLSGVTGAVELAPGLWRWEAFHPHWKRTVASVLVAGERDLVLIDPLAPQGDEADAFWTALDRASRVRRLSIVVTVPDHARSAPAIVARYPGAPLHAAPRRRRRSLAGIDVAPLEPETALPAGLKAIDTSRADERAIWIAPQRTLVVGDVLLGTADGGLAVCPADWLPFRATRASVAAALGPLLDHEIDHIVPTHGAPPPRPRAALAAAVAEAAGTAPTNGDGP